MAQKISADNYRELSSVFEALCRDTKAGSDAERDCNTIDKSSLSVVQRHGETSYHLSNRSGGVTQYIQANCFSSVVGRTCQVETSRSPFPDSVNAAITIFGGGCVGSEISGRYCLVNGRPLLDEAGHPVGPNSDQCPIGDDVDFGTTDVFPIDGSADADGAQEVGPDLPNDTMADVEVAPEVTYDVDAVFNPDEAIHVGGDADAEVAMEVTHDAEVSIGETIDTGPELPIEEEVIDTPDTISESTIAFCTVAEANSCYGVKQDVSTCLYIDEIIDVCVHVDDKGKPTKVDFKLTFDPIYFSDPLLSSPIGLTFSSANGSFPGAFQKGAYMLFYLDGTHGGVFGNTYVWESNEGPTITYDKQTGTVRLSAFNQSEINNQGCNAIYHTDCGADGPVINQCIETQ